MIDLTDKTYDIKIYQKTYVDKSYEMKEYQLHDIIKKAFNHYGIFDVQAIMICATKDNKIKVQVMYCNRISAEYIIHNNVDIMQFDIDINNMVLEELTDFWK